MHNVTLFPGGAVSLGCSLYQQEHQVTIIEWYCLIGTVVPSGAHYAEALEVNLRPLFYIYRY